jgi:hypothetical protein
LSVARCTVHASSQGNKDRRGAEGIHDRQQGPDR